MYEYEKINARQVSSEIDGFTLERYQQFYRYLPESVESVLDVGCNTGRGGAVFKQLKPHLRLIGLDCVRSRLDSLPPSIYDKTLCCYSTEITLDNSSIDAVVAGEFIEHLLPADVQKTFDEFFQVLKEGSVLLLTTPNPTYIRLKLSGKSVLSNVHLSEHDPVRLAKSLKKHGFSNILVRGSGKVTRFLGERWPVLSCYGSYLLRAEKQ